MGSDRWLFHESGSVKSQKLKFTQANIFLKSVDAMGYG